MRRGLRASPPANHVIPQRWDIAILIIIAESSRVYEFSAHREFKGLRKSALSSILPSPPSTRVAVEGKSLGMGPACADAHGASPPQV